MFGIHTISFHKGHKMRFTHEVVTADEHVKHSHEIVGGRDDTMLGRAISNRGRPAYLISTVDRSCAYDWHTDAPIDVIAENEGYCFARPTNAAITADGIFTVYSTGYDGYDLRNAKGATIISLKNHRLTVDAMGTRLYVTCAQSLRYEPIGEILPNGWYIPNEKQISSTGSVRHCAAGNIVARIWHGRARIIDTRMPDDIVADITYGCRGVSASCTFVSDDIIAVYAAVREGAGSYTYTPFIIDMRGTNIYELCGRSREKPLSAPMLFAC